MSPTVAFNGLRGAIAMVPVMAWAVFCLRRGPNRADSDANASVGDKRRTQNELHFYEVVLAVCAVWLTWKVVGIVT